MAKPQGNDENGGGAIKKENLFLSEEGSDD
jgi:hypothetical protein